MLQTADAGRTLEALPIGAGLAALGERFVEFRDPTPLPDPYLIAFNPEVAALLELDQNEAKRPEFLNLAAGNARFWGTRSYAALYAGHQFGVFVPQLGDGRAITLGEIETSGGPLEWQVKGAGLTAFSRFGDGRAVLRSTIREYLASEALHHLGIPTTRALAIAGSDAPVHRETTETSAVLTRIAPSHLRFGSFEVFHYRRQFDEVATLADYAIARYYPELADLPLAEKYVRFLRAVVLRTAHLAAQWQVFGFAHGVLNTDNMSILGLTIDYGPYGFIDAYEPGFICNHSDETGRYAFDRQPGIALWNLHALAEALSSLIPEKPDAEGALGEFEGEYRAASIALYVAKLGLHEARPGDVDLIVDFLDLLAAERADYTRAFRALSLVADPSTETEPAPLRFGNRDRWEAWLKRYRERLAADGGDPRERAASMNRRNPKYILRNYLAQLAIEAAQKRDYSEVERLHAVLRAPFDEQPENERYAAEPPDWAQEISVSCSS